MMSVQMKAKVIAIRKFLKIKVEDPYHRIAGGGM